MSDLETVVEALFNLYHSLADMGDSMDDECEYIESIKNKPFETQVLELKDMIVGLVTDENSERLESEIVYEKVDEIEDSTIYLSVKEILSFVEENKVGETTMQVLKMLTSRLEKLPLLVINTAYEAAHEYCEYLDEKCFGLVTNSYFTVGHMITKEDEEEFEEYKGYSYVCHKDFNTLKAPQVAIAALFKEDGTGNIQADIKLARRGYVNEKENVCAIVGYIKNFHTVTLKASNTTEENGKILARAFNDIGLSIRLLAGERPELMRILGYGKPLKKLSVDVKSST